MDKVDVKDVLMAIGAIVIIILSIIATPLIFYFLGILARYIFHLDYEWTILHGIFVALVYWLIRGLFRSGKEG